MRARLHFSSIIDLATEAFDRRTCVVAARSADVEHRAAMLPRRAPRLLRELCRSCSRAVDGLGRHAFAAPGVGLLGQSF